MKQNFRLLVVALASIISIKGFAQCTNPTNLSYSYNNAVSTFSWDAVPGAVSYEIEFQYPGYGWQYIEYSDVTPTNSLTLTGIYASGIFDYRVRATCSNNDVSGYSYAQFTVPCTEPSNVVVSSIGNTSATFTWASETGWPSPQYHQVLYRKLGAITWTSSGSLTVNTFTASSLSQGTTYEYLVRKLCSNFNSTSVSGQFTTTGISCSAPVSIAASNIIIDQATISWASVSGVSSYTLEYKPSYAGAYTTVNTSSNSFVLSNLIAGTVYNIRVKSNCGTAASTYTVGSFTTPTFCAAAGSNSAEWIDLFEVGSISRSSGAEVGGYVNTGLATSMRVGQNYSGRFSAGFNGGNRTLYVTIYVDLNRNGNFTDAGENVLATTTVQNRNNKNISIRIPNGTAAGATRMRVVMSRVNNTSPCSSGFLGEVEDYDVDITPASNKTDETDIEDATTSINAIEVSSISIYPNPSSGTFNIDFLGEATLAEYAVYSLDGKLVQQFKNDMALNSVSVNLSDVAEGIYILQTLDNAGVKSSHKLYKK